MFTAANKGSYIAQAGQANPVLNAFQVANAYSFDAFDLAQSAMKADAAKYISKVENEAKKNYYKSVGKADIQGQKELDKVRGKAQGQQRMAGVLGTLGALSYGTSRYFQNKNNPPPAPEKRESADISGVLEGLESQVQAYKDSQTALDNLNNTVGKLTDLTKPKPAGTEDTSTSTTGGVKPVQTSTVTKPLVSGGGGWSSLGATIKFAEGTYRKGDKAYNTGFGYNMFDDLSKHPDTKFNNTSAAAGAYQFMPQTWAGVKSALKLTDFGPEAQEQAGEYLTTKRGVQTDKPFTTVQELRSAFDKLAPEWASIPLSSTGKSYYDGDGVNSARSFESLRDFYEKQVGYKLAD